MSAARRPAVELKSVAFRRERQATWRRLEGLVRRMEKGGVRSLGADELASVPALYRATMSSLSVARAISLDRNLREYLESLAARAYFRVYGGRRRLGPAVARFFAETFPRAVRALRGHVLLAALFTGLGALVGYAMTRADPDAYYAFVAPGLAGGRDPSATTESLREVLYSGGGGASLANFATFLFSHNAGIGILCFALGFAAGVPVFLLLVSNGAMLGAFAALYASRGLAFELWGWILPHGVTELLALVLCGAAGLSLGQGLVFPGRLSRLENLARRGRQAALVVLGAVALALVAALIEGFFRQLVQDVSARYAVVALTAVGWSLYFLFAGRRAEVAP